MSHDNLEFATNISEGLWIAQELTGTRGAVTDLVPDRFDSYVRILHPAETRDGALVTWANVATTLGQTMHSCRQWHILVSSSDPESFEGSQWSGLPPDRGDLRPEILEPLCQVLEQNTSDPNHCFFGLWAGLTWTTLRADPETCDSKASRADFHSLNQVKGPRLKLPPIGSREYVILTGPLSAATEIRESKHGGVAPNSPNLMWPVDRAWFVATDIDLDSTLVGGNVELCKAIIEADEFEAWPVGPRDSLTADADE